MQSGMYPIYSGPYTAASMGGSGMLAGDDGERQIVEMLDTNGRQFWQPAESASLRDSGVGGMILQFPYWVTSYMPAIAAQAKCLLHGDFNAYTLATADPGLYIKRVTGETDKNLHNKVAFIAEVRCGGVASGGPTGTDTSEAYKYLTMKA